MIDNLSLVDESKSALFVSKKGWWRRYSMADQHYLFDILNGLTNEKKKTFVAPIPIDEKERHLSSTICQSTSQTKLILSFPLFMYFQVAKWEWRFSDISSLHITSLLFAMAGLIITTKRLQLKWGDGEIIIFTFVIIRALCGIFW